jgi:hypothetical protein
MQCAECPYKEDPLLKLGNIFAESCFDFLQQRRTCHMVLGRECHAELHNTTKEQFLWEHASSV